MTTLHGSFIWYELMTPDPAAAKAFYDAVVGWEMEAEPSGPIDYRMINRSTGGHAGGVMRLTPDMLAKGARPMWAAYVGVDDVDAAVAAATEAGATAIMPAWEQPGVGRLAMLADPQGALLYIMKPVPPEHDPDATSDAFSVDRPQHVRWNELSTDDPAAATAYHAALFGWGQEGAMEMGDLGRYRFVQHGDTTIGAIMPRMPGSPASAWTYYVGVDDIDRAAAAVSASGGTIVQPPIEIPGGEFSLVAFDPQGAVFGLVGPRR